MEIADVEIIQLELKYCERCGGLWLRLRGTQEVYCGGCVLEMRELPAAGRAKHKPRLPKNHRFEIKKLRTDRATVCGEGGTA
jgi:Zn-finger nucleic acid-binding protein